MGVSGCGKTTVGAILGKRMALPFYDADTFHLASNIEKMSKGIPLGDEDRFPWLQNLSARIEQWEREGGAIVACSALKKIYRDILEEKVPGKVLFVYLHGSKEIIAQRMRGRTGHYMPAALLDSQFAALEPPDGAMTVSIEDAPECIAAEIAEKLRFRKMGTAKNTDRHSAR